MKRWFVPDGWNRVTGRPRSDLVAVRERDPNALIHMIPNNGRGLSQRQKQNDVSYSIFLVSLSSVPNSSFSGTPIRLYIVSELDIHIRLEAVLKLVSMLTRIISTARESTNANLT